MLWGKHSVCSSDDWAKWEFIWRKEGLILHHVIYKNPRERKKERKISKGETGVSRFRERQCNPMTGEEFCCKHLAVFLVLILLFCLIVILCLPMTLFPSDSERYKGGRRVTYWEWVIENEKLSLATGRTLTLTPLSLEGLYSGLRRTT